MITRLLQKSDIDGLLAIENACFSHPWNALSWQEEFTRADFFVLCLNVDGKDVGYICGTTIFEDSELLKVAVLPAFRGKGYGDTLMKAFLDEVTQRGAERNFLEVREGNISARKLYEKNGYMQTRLRKNYYEDGENAVEMVKKL